MIFFLAQNITLNIIVGVALLNCDHRQIETMYRSMEIVDGHMHLWTPDTHPWLNAVKNGGHPAGDFGT